MKGLLLVIIIMQIVVASQRPKRRLQSLLTTKPNPTQIKKQTTHQLSQTQQTNTKQLPNHNQRLNQNRMIVFNLESRILNKKTKASWQKDSRWDMFVYVALTLFIDNIRDRNIKVAGQYANFQTLREQVMYKGNKFTNDVLNLMKGEGININKIKDYGIQFKNTYDMVKENMNEFRGARGYSTRRSYRTLKMGGIGKYNYCTFSPLKDGHQKFVEKVDKQLCICTQNIVKDCVKLKKKSGQYSDQNIQLWFYTGKDSDETILNLNKCNADTCDSYASVYNDAAEKWDLTAMQFKWAIKSHYVLFNDLMDTLKDEEQKTIALAMGTKENRVNCLLSQKYKECRDLVDAVLKKDEKKYEDKSIKSVIENGQRVWNSMRFGGYFQMLKYYYDLFKYNTDKLKSSKLGTQQSQYFCPYSQSIVQESKIESEGEPYCACNSVRIGQCQRMSYNYEEYQQQITDWKLKYSYLGYIMRQDKDTNEGTHVTGEKNDNWLTGVKSCNPTNCEEYATLAFAAAKKVIDIKRQYKFNRDNKRIANQQKETEKKKKDKEEGKEEPKKTKDQQRREEAQQEKIDQEQEKMDEKMDENGENGDGQTSGQQQQSNDNESTKSQSDGIDNKQDQVQDDDDDIEVSGECSEGMKRFSKKLENKVALNNQILSESIKKAKNSRRFRKRHDRKE